MSKAEILRLFDRLDAELQKAGVQGELYLVGGAVMCLVFEARPSTQDLDGYFQPTRTVRQAAARIAAEAGLDPNWLNDAVKGYLSPHGDFAHYLERGHLKVFCAEAEYLLAMKCLALRIGEEFQDLADVRYLLRHLGLRDRAAVLEVIARYYPLDRIPQKTFYALDELLSDPER